MSKPKRTNLMKLVCPSCGLTASAEAWINDAAARDLLLAVATLPAPLPKATLPYLGLFRPEKQALRWDKAGKIVSELAKSVLTGFVQVQGKVARPCPPRIWAQAMEQMIERRDAIRRPLPNHNYLRQVAWQLADEADALGESRRNAGRDLSRNRGGSGETSVGLKPDLHLHGVREMILSPMDAYIQGQREDKPTQEEMQEWSRRML
jgi:hypothetical protein